MVSEERSFLHQIATPMTIVRLVLKKLDRSATELSPEQLHEQISKALHALEDMEQLHASRKEAITRAEAR